jgi:hypothetical protein
VVCSCGFVVEAAGSADVATAFAEHRRRAEPQPTAMVSGSQWRGVPACKKAAEQEPLPSERRNGWDGAPEDDLLSELRSVRHRERRAAWQATG